MNDSEPQKFWPQVGDPVAVCTWGVHKDRVVITTIERLTGSRIIVDGNAYRRSDLRMLGSEDDFYRVLCKVDSPRVLRANAIESYYRMKAGLHNILNADPNDPTLIMDILDKAIDLIESTHLKVSKCITVEDKK